MSGDSGGGSKNQVTTQNTDPWGPQQAPLQQSFEDATKLYNAGGLNIPYYQGQTVAGLAPETTQAQQMIANRAQQGSGALQGANNYVQGILNGNDTGLLNGAMDRVRTGVNANYSAAGRYGSGSHDAAVTDRLGGLIFDRQAQAAQMAPSLAQADYYDAQQLAGVGQDRQAYMQQMINADIDKYNWTANAPGNAIANYQSLIGGGYGGGSQVTKQPVQNQGGNSALQWAGLGASLGGSLLGAMY